MRRTTILNAKQVKRTSFSEAEQLFTKHCKLKNLSPQTMRYYAEDLKYFHACVPVQYVDEVSQDAFENFIVSELDAGKKITSLNSRIRGLRVFFKFCAEREYMKPITLKLMKEDEIIKEPYTDAELRRLLKRPEGNSWVEWRTWASMRNTLPALHMDLPRAKIPRLALHQPPELRHKILPRFADDQGRTAAKRDPVSDQRCYE